MQVVLACHWLLECAIHTWPESQRRGLTILVDGTGVEDDAAHCARLSALLPPVIVARTQPSLHQLICQHDWNLRIYHSTPPTLEVE